MIKAKVNFLFFIKLDDSSFAKNKGKSLYSHYLKMNQGQKNEPGQMDSWNNSLTRKIYNNFGNSYTYSQANDNSGKKNFK